MISKFFIDRPIFAIVISIMIVVLGFTAMKRLPIEQYSDITPPMVQISAEYVGADASTVDKSVATPIGQSVMGVSKMLYMNSTSANDGSMSLAVTFDIDSDPDLNTVLTQNRVTSAMSLLPDPVKAQAVTTQKQNQNYIMVFALYSKGDIFDNEFLSNYAYINVRNELLKVDGVGAVSIMGAGNYSMRIWIQPDRLAYLGLTVNDISSAVEAQSNIFPIGKLGAEPTDNPPAFTYTIISEQAINTPQEYENIIIRTLSDGTTLRLKDVARVELGCQTYGTKARFNGENAVAVVVYQSPGSNAVEAGQQVITTMNRLSDKFPDGIEWGSIVDAKKIIVRSVEEILYTFLFVLFLVAIIIYIFLQNARATIIPLIAIPVSLIGTFILFPLFGLSLNTLSLLGLVLAVGLVVDDAVVVVEAVQLNMEKGMTAYDATVEAMRKVSRAIIATTIVLVAVFIPVAQMGGISGRLFWQFAITIALSFVISAFNALSLTPALCTLILKRKNPVDISQSYRGDESNNRYFGIFNQIFARQREFYIRIADRLFARRSRTWIMVCTAIILLFVGFRIVPSGFMPEEDQGYLMLAVTLPDAASLERTFEVVSQVSSILENYDFIENVVAISGFNMMSGIESTNNAIVFISLSESNKTKISTIVNQINGRMYEQVSGGLVYAFGPPAVPGLGVSSGFSMELLGLSGNSPTDMQHYANLFTEEAMKRPEISMVMNQFSTTIPQKALITNYEAVKKSGVNIDQLHGIISSYLGGSYINNFNRFGQLYQTYIQAEASYRRDEKAFENFFVPGDNGVQIPLLSLVSLKDTLGVQYLNRFNMLPSISLSGSAATGYSSGDVVKALESVAEEVLPDDMSYGWSNVTYQEVSSSKDSWIIYLFILGFIYLILAALYESWAVPVTVLLGIPFALLGAIATIYITRFFNPIYVNDIFFQISAVVLIALSAKNAILIIEYAHTAYLSGSNLKEATIEALRERYRPIVMTSLAFMLGAIPLMAASGIFSVARNIIGVSLFGGMLAVTYLAITIYPSLYESISHYIKRTIK